MTTQQPTPAAPAGAPALADLSVAQMTDGFRAGDFTPLEVLDSVRERVESCEPTLNALWWQDLGADGAAVVAASTTRTARPRARPVRAGRTARRWDRWTACR